MICVHQHIQPCNINILKLTSLSDWGYLFRTSKKVHFVYSKLNLRPKNCLLEIQACNLEGPFIYWEDSKVYLIFRPLLICKKKLPSSYLNKPSPLHESKVLYKPYIIKVTYCLLLSTISHVTRYHPQDYATQETC